MSRLVIPVLLAAGFRPVEHEARPGEELAGDRLLVEEPRDHPREDAAEEAGPAVCQELFDICRLRVVSQAEFDANEAALRRVEKSIPQKGFAQVRWQETGWRPAKGWPPAGQRIPWKHIHIYNI